MKDLINRTIDQLALYVYTTYKCVGGFGWNDTMFVIWTFK